MKVIRGETPIEVPHLDGNIKAIHPFFRGNYFNLANKIPSEQRPNMAETVSLIYDAYKNPEDDRGISKEIKSIMKKGLFYTFDGILYLPREGILFQSNPEFSKGAKTADGLIMDKNNLISKLGSKEEKGIVYSNDGSIRFLKGYNFKIEFQGSSDIVKNPFAISLAGQEGAEKLAYIVDQYKLNSYLSSIINPSGFFKRVAGVYSDWNHDWLDVDGNNRGSVDIGCSFRVVRPQKNSTGNQC